MNPRTLFIIGLAVTSLAVAIAFRVNFKQNEPTFATRLSDPNANAGSRPNARPGPSRPADSRLGPAVAETARHPALALEDLKVGLGPEAVNDPALVASAASVERHAHRQLEQLSRTLTLGSGQRARLFGIFAAGAEEYHPAMVVPGLTHADASLVQAGELGVNDVLLPEQREERVERSLDDAALWKEVFETLKRQLDESMPELPAANPEPDETTPAPSTGRRNLHELLGN